MTSSRMFIRPADFVRRAAPILGREGVDRQVADAELGAGFEHPPQVVDAGAVAGQTRQAPGARPTAVAVHDDRHMVRTLWRGFRWQ